MNKQLTYISPFKLYHHPNNPRREYKNIPELAESIRARGVMQNLTVVPYEPAIHTGVVVDDPNDSYLVIIGNRRMEGARMAGVDAVPCIIETGTTLVDQITAMEIENNLRESTDPSKQAANYQLRLSSQTTIRNRLKLLDLDFDKMSEADQRGGTLADYAKLSKIKDVKLKNEVLEHVGTPNFQAELKRAMDLEKRLAYAEEVKIVLATFAKEETPGWVENGEWCCMETYAWWNKKKPVVPEDSKDRKYMFMVYGEEVRLYRKRNKEEKLEIKETKKVAQKHEKINAELEEARLRAYDLRMNFVKSVTAAKAKKNFGKISAYAAPILLRKVQSYSPVDTALLAELLSIPYVASGDTVSQPEFEDVMAKTPEYGLLAMIYCMVDDNTVGYYQVIRDNDLGCPVASHKANAPLDHLYELLTSLGYAMSDEEKALQDGTSKLFPVNQENNNKTDAA